MTCTWISKRTKQNERYRNREVYSIFVAIQTINSRMQFIEEILNTMDTCVYVCMYAFRIESRSKSISIGMGVGKLENCRGITGLTTVYLHTAKFARLIRKGLIDRRWEVLQFKNITQNRQWNNFRRTLNRIWFLLRILIHSRINEIFPLGYIRISFFERKSLSLRFS